MDNTIQMHLQTERYHRSNLMHPKKTNESKQLEQVQHLKILLHCKLIKQTIQTNCNKIKEQTNCEQ